MRGFALAIALSMSPVLAASQETVRVAHMELPHYPEIARDAGVQGDVRVSVTVGSDGKIIDDDAMADRRMLRDTALANIKKWTFEPTFSSSRRFNVFYQFMLRERTNLLPDEEITVDEEIPRRIRIIASPSPLAEGVAGFQISRADEVHYPPLARQVRIAGTVKLFVVLDQVGRVFEVDVESGHPLLIPAAVESIQKWKALPPGVGPKAFCINYEFVLRGKSDTAPHEKVTLDLPRSRSNRSKSVAVRPLSRGARPESLIHRGHTPAVNDFRVRNPSFS